MVAELADDDDDDVVDDEFDDGSGKMLFSIRLVEFVNAFRLFVVLLLAFRPLLRPFMQLDADEQAALKFDVT